MVNPYDPQNPAMPHYFGGRQKMLATAGERMEKAKVRKQSGGILIRGFRGVGKTSLLNKILDIAQTADSRPVFASRLRLSKTTSDSELYRSMADSLLEDISARGGLAGKIAKMGEKIQSAGLSGFKIELGESWKEKSPHQQWRTVLNRLGHAAFVLVCIDDADYLSKEAIGVLKTIVEEQKEVPVLLAVAGGPEFEERLIDEYSPVARIFSGASFDLNSFETEETREALQNPIRDQPDVRWTDEGIVALQDFTKGYPFLVQCLASAAYRSGKPIDAGYVRESIHSALTIARPWLDNKLKTASDQDLLCFYKIANSNRFSLRSADLTKMGVPAPYVGRLVALRVIRLVSRGHYDLVEAPMVAYYHMLKRGLPMEKN